MLGEVQDIYGKLSGKHSEQGYDCCCYWVAQLCLTLCSPMNCSTPGFSVHHSLPEFAQTHVIKSVIPPSHLILCCPLLLLPSIFLSIRVFSNILTWLKIYKSAKEYSSENSPSAPVLQVNSLPESQWMLTTFFCRSQEIVYAYQYTYFLFLNKFYMFSNFLCLEVLFYFSLKSD